MSEKLESKEDHINNLIDFFCELSEFKYTMLKGSSMPEDWDELEEEHLERITMFKAYLKQLFTLDNETLKTLKSRYKVMAFINHQNLMKSKAPKSAKRRGDLEFDKRIKEFNSLVEGLIYEISD